MLRGATLIGLVVVCLLSRVTVLAAAFYNLFSELLGGVEVTVVGAGSRSTLASTSGSASGASKNRTCDLILIRDAL